MKLSFRPKEKKTQTFKQTITNVAKQYNKANLYLDLVTDQKASLVLIEKQAMTSKKYPIGQHLKGKCSLNVIFKIVLTCRCGSDHYMLFKTQSRDCLANKQLQTLHARRCQVYKQSPSHSGITDRESTLLLVEESDRKKTSAMQWNTFRVLIRALLLGQDSTSSYIYVCLVTFCSVGGVVHLYVV